MGYLSPALSLVGTGLNAYGDIEQGKATANAANYNAQVAENNAKYSSQAGQAQAEAQSLRDAQTQGRVTASLAANGVDTKSGSALRVQTGAREAGSVDINNVENNALLRAYGYQDTAALDRDEAKQATEAGEMKAFGTVIGGASSLPDSFQNMFGDSGGGGDAIAGEGDAVAAAG